MGVIGAGSMAVGHHLPNLAYRSQDVELVAVCRQGPELLERIRDRFGFELATEDYREVLDADIDACIIASPTGLHYEHAAAALDAGVHVLLEKPMTIRPADAWNLVSKAQVMDRHLVIAFGWNYKPMVRAAKRLMLEHGIGELEHVQVHMASATRELLTNSGAYPGADLETIPEARTWTDPSVSGGGYAQAQLTHALGLALWLSGLRGESVFAFMGNPLNAPVELTDAIAVKFTEGAIGSVSGASCHLGASANKHQLEVRLMGSQGQLHVDLERERVWLYRNDGIDIELEIEPDGGLYDCIGPPTTLVDLALGRDVANESPGDLGARTVEILEAAYRSAGSGSMETVG